jgi:hypothetical protein
MLGVASDVDGSELGLFLKELSSRVVCCSHFLSAKNFLKYQIPLSSILQSNSRICSVAWCLYISLLTMPKQEPG